MTSLLLPLVAACLATAVAGTSLVLVDNVGHSYLHSGPKLAMDKSSVASLMAAATGLIPGSTIGADLSRELSVVLKPSAFAKPRAFVALNIAGVPNDAFAELFASHRGQRALELTGEGCPALAIVNGLSLLSAANPSIQLTVADHIGVQDCEGSCTDKNFAGAVEALELNLDALDLTQKEAKLFAVEFGSVYAGLKRRIQQLKEAASPTDVELFEVSLMGLRGLTSANGQESDVVLAARRAVIRLLQWAVESLDSAYNGDVVYQVLLLEQGPERVGTLKQLANWKEATRRQLLQSEYPPVDPAEQVNQAKLFSAKAAGYGAFILLLYFSMAAIWCMCNMPFKQDTLLYGSKKDQ